MDRRQETGLWQVYKERYREREKDAVEEPCDEESHPNDQQDNVNRLPRYLCSISPIPHSQTNTYPAVLIIIELKNFNTQTDRQTYVDDWRAHTHTNKLGLI